MDISVLIIGEEGRLRDGLRTILLFILGIKEVITADDEFAASHLISQETPSLIIVDGCDTLMSRCYSLKKILQQTGKKPWIVIANSLEQSNFAQKCGADVVLMQGFSTAELHSSITNLVPVKEVKLLEITQAK